MRKFVSTIILAAGKSSRAGKLKQLLPIGHTTLLGRTLHNYRQSLSNEIILVVGYKAGDIVASIDTEDIVVVNNPDFKLGMSASIQYGLLHSNAEADAFLIALADQPSIDANTINRLIEAFLNSKKSIIVPLYNNRRGNPVIFSAVYRDELMRLSGDKGGREIVTRHAEAVMEVSVECEGVIQDIDTADEYRALLDRLNQRFED